ncbi:MAG: hypothetical protein WD002_13020 [Pseudomonadales bacterium]
MASHLSTSARQKAENFILANANNLAIARYRFHFEGGDAANVIAALQHYQNADGGFGGGLEADLRTKNSSVIATTIALQIVNEADNPGSPLVDNALRYLADRYDGANWPLINADCNDAPHAPWWTFDPTVQAPSGFAANPGAEVLSYLITFDAMDKLTRQDLLNRSIEHIASHPLEMHELLCYLRLFDNPRLPTSAAQSLLPHLIRRAGQLVKVKPANWDEYSLTPIDVVPGPDAPLADLFSEALDQNIDYRIAAQKDDGSWSPAWSWGNAFPGAWREAELEIKVDLTLRFLLQLARFDRLDS